MSQHLDCTVVNMHLEAYVDGEVSSLKAKMISMHLETCGVCAAEYERALEVKKILHDLPHFDGFGSMPKLADLQKAQRRRVMFALAAGVLITFILFPFIGKPTFDTPTEATVERSVHEAQYAFALVAKFSHRAGLLPDKTNDSRGRLIPKLKHTNDLLHRYMGEVSTLQIFNNKRSLK